MSEILLLLVEDGVVLHIVLEEALIDGGFQVVVTNSGARAMEELNKGAERFNGVLTDIRLGTGPSGWDVAHRARELVPDMPIVYMTGDSSSEWSANGVPNSLMIVKPFADVQILTAISQLINERF
jgi:CheY-like chemotaxis protein